jgi:selenium metabolism protein YedF
MTMANTESVQMDTVIFLGSDIIGRGEDRQLGGMLMQKYLHTLSGHRLKPKAILLMNDGVRLVAEGSPVIEELRLLGSQGVDILACSTCLDRFGLTARVGAGLVSNMYDITDAMLKADKVVSM